MAVWDSKNCENVKSMALMQYDGSTRPSSFFPLIVIAQTVPKFLSCSRFCVVVNKVDGVFSQRVWHLASYSLIVYRLYN